MTAIHDSILDVIGNTPVVQLNRIGRDYACDIVAKCEFLNPGGSVKDRIGVRMLLEAEKAGHIKPGDTIIEPTSGNTGIGIAMTAAVRGYRVIITMPEKMSREKQVVLESLGAEIVRTPTEAAWDSPESHISVAQRMKELIPNAHILDQYANANNPQAHSEGTGEEIVAQCDGKLDAIVMTAGTGGTITGVAKTIREKIPHCRVIGVDPEGSILAGPGEISSYKVEGIGYDFFPDVLDNQLIDEYIKTNDKDSFLMSRRLIREEGLLVGGSSGAATWAALNVAKTMKAGQRVLVILPDSVRNYMTGFVDRSWMLEHSFLNADQNMDTVKTMLAALSSQKIISIDVQSTVENAIELFSEHGVSQIPCVDKDKLSGMITEHDILKMLLDKRITLKTSVVEVMQRSVSSVTMDCTIGALVTFLSQNTTAIVVDASQKILAVVTKTDLIHYIAQRSTSSRS